jgi:hemoglobin-like flavoprotein
MTNSEILLVKTSWIHVSAIDAETVGTLFYNRLFELRPDLRHMFNRSTMAEQSRKLLSMLGYVIAKLDRLEDILEEVRKLARRHTSYGVHDDHYTAVGAALLWTLEKGLGEHWNETLAEAWTTTYSVLSEAMMTAQHNIEPAVTIL